MRRLRRRDGFDDLFNQMEDFVDQFQELGRDFTSGVSTGIPVDIREEDGEYILEADLPGVQKDELNVKADENTLEISADVNQEVKEEGENYVRKERSTRSYRRKVAWPSPVEPESVEAEYENGILTVTAEKNEESGKDVEVE